MDYREIIKKLGGPSAVASRMSDAIGREVTPNQVSMWGSRQEIPSAYVVVFAALMAASGMDVPSEMVRWARFERKGEDVFARINI